MRPVLILAALAVTCSFVQQAAACDECQQATRLGAPLAVCPQVVQQTVMVPGALTTRRIPQAPLVVPQPDLIVTEQGPATYSTVQTSTLRTDVVPDMMVASTSSSEAIQHTGFLSNARAQHHLRAAAREAKAQQRHLAKAARFSHASLSNSGSQFQSFATLAPASYAVAAPAYSYRQSYGTQQNLGAQQQAPPQNQADTMHVHVDINGQPVYDDTQAMPDGGQAPGPGPAPQFQPQPQPKPAVLPPAPSGGL